MRRRHGHALIGADPPVGGQRHATFLRRGDFAGLSAVTRLHLNDNELSELPSGVFEGLSTLDRLYLGNNAFTRIPGGSFKGLSTLTELYLGDNRISELSGDAFDGLSALQKLGLADNDLTSLPDGLFVGMDALTSLYLGGNDVDPLQLTVRLEKVGEDRVRGVLPTGAPFAADIAVTVASGTIGDSATKTLTIAQGATESAAFAVTRTADTTAAVTADITTLPALPSDHSGYALTKPADPPLIVIAEIPTVSIEAANAEVTEGDDAAFTLARTGPAEEALTVTVHVTEDGSVLKSPSTDGSAVSATAEFAAGAATVSLAVATDDDATDELLSGAPALGRSGHRTSAGRNRLRRGPARPHQRDGGRGGQRPAGPAAAARTRSPGQQPRRARRRRGVRAQRPRRHAGVHHRRRHRRPLRLHADVG